MSRHIISPVSKTRKLSPIRKSGFMSSQDDEVTSMRRNGFMSPEDEMSSRKNKRY